MAEKQQQRQQQEKKKTTYRKILVPHDGSDPSDRSLECAAKVARAAGARITLLNIVEEIPVPPLLHPPQMHSKATGETVSMEKYLKELYQELKGEATRMLNAKREKLYSEAAPDVVVDVKVVVGYPSDEILQFAREEQCDLIVMGTKGLRGASRVAALGSVARKVSEGADCPVILVS